MRHLFSLLTMTLILTACADEGGDTAPVTTGPAGATVERIPVTCESTQSGVFVDKYNAPAILSYEYCDETTCYRPSLTLHIDSFGEVYGGVTPDAVSCWLLVVR